jgi:tetratricopeptide (TPR) repeat protein
MTLQNNSKKAFRGIHLFESALFVMFVCIIALRLSFMENPHIESLSLRGSFYDNFLSVSISSLLIISAVIWIVVRLWNGNLRYRLGAFELGILIFIIGCVISTIAASNRRAGITDSITILSSMLTAFVLGQIADTAVRKKILLFVIIAIGVANVYQCSEQFFSSNKFMIEEYEKEPTGQLERLGIEPGSFEQMLYENRLYSKDVRGFFTTGNSTASLLVLAIFCTFAVFDFKPDFSKAKNTVKKLWLPIVLLLIFLLGLFETHSKGAIVSFVIAVVLLFLVVRFGPVLSRRRFLILFAIVALIIVCIVSIVSYGITHNTLPGGNSMLVRWQYWSATVKIIRDNFWTGIGGGNFGSYYTQYKIPQAIETVRDPHSFVLNIAAQYGIIGLAGFCIAIFFPIIKGCMQNKTLAGHRENNITTVARDCGILAVLMLLFIRPIFVRTELAGGTTVILYILALMYAAPAFCFGVTFWLCGRNQEQTRPRQVYSAALLCGLFAMLIHNLIDFALFEPGIMTAFWVCIAIVYADWRTEATDDEIKPNKLKKIILTAPAIIIITAIIWFCIIPGAKAAIKTEQANRLFARGEIEEATILLSFAQKDDTLNPTPAALAGRMLIYKFKTNPGNPPKILLRAENLLLAAIERDRADYSNYENLAEVYMILAETNSEKRVFWFEKARFCLQQALRRYPSSAQLHTKSAKTAEQLGLSKEAIEHYKKAIEIEDAYREQFKIMYPGKEVFSRMGKVNYINAKEKLEELMRMKEKQ